MPAPDGRIKLRVLVDRGSVEVFGQDGRIAMSTGVIHPETNLSCRVFARGGSATVADLAVHELKSIWK
jgi:sucrose-6-phosphate hydrolase SacC (GH32 family)